MGGAEDVKHVEDKGLAGRSKAMGKAAMGCAGKQCAGKSWAPLPPPPPAAQALPARESGGYKLPCVGRMPERALQTAGTRRCGTLRAASREHCIWTGCFATAALRPSRTPAARQPMRQTFWLFSPAIHCRLPRLPAARQCGGHGEELVKFSIASAKLPELVHALPPLLSYQSTAPPAAVSSACRPLVLWWAEPSLRE